MKIMIGTPAYGYQVTAEYHSSVLKLVQEFAKRRPEIAFESKIVGSALLAMNRNVLAALALHDPGFTHLLFLDGDMGFAAELIERMIDFDKPWWGASIPTASASWRDHRLGPRWSRAAKALDAGNTYVGVPLIEAGRAETLGPFIRAREIGTGVMLIKREVLEQLAAACPELRTDDPVYRGLGMGPITQMFDSYQAPSGLFVGEDVAFCRRWIERCGGEIWACYDAQIAHVGRDVVRGNYADRLSAGASQGGERTGASLR
jgi:hypothetical protein